jgi:hypothetical protein
MKWHAGLMLAAIGLVSFTAQSRAADLGPGDTVTPSVVANPLTAAGFTVEATTSGTFTTPAESGTYSAYVVRTDAGTLDFVYKFSNDASSESKLERMTAYNFAGFTTNVGYVAGSGDVAPTTANRTNDGEVVGFNFLASGVPQGQNTDIMVIATNATKFTTGTYTFQDGGATTVAAYAPTTGAVVTPEPSSFLSAGLGGILLLGVVRRHRRAAKA